MNSFIRKAVMFLIALISVALVSNSVEATDVGGIIDADTTWDLAGSPYVITSDVQVAEGVTLTVDPGVVIGNGYIRIWGNFIAVGTTLSQVIYNDVNFKTESDLAIVNITFSEFNGGTIVHENGNMTLEDSKINNIGVFWVQYSDAYIERNIFNNSAGIFTDHRGNNIDGPVKSQAANLSVFGDLPG